MNAIHSGFGGHVVELLEMANEVFPKSTMSPEFKGNHSITLGQNKTWVLTIWCHDKCYSFSITADEALADTPAKREFLEDLRSEIEKSSELTEGQVRYFQWIRDVCALLGWELLKGADLVEDESWFSCFDDGMSPEAAVAKGKARGVLVSVEGKWVYQPGNYTEEHKMALDKVCDTLQAALPEISSEDMMRSLIVGGDCSDELIQEPADGGGFASRNPNEDVKDGGK